MDDFSIVMSYDDIKNKNYSLSAGQYFEVKLKYVDISSEEFSLKLKILENNLHDLESKSEKLRTKITTSLKNLKYE